MYLTLIKQKQRTQQVSLFGTTTITEEYCKFVNVDITPDKFSEQMITNAKNLETAFNTFIDSINFDITDTMQEHYTTFRIPKKTTGYREINAPSDELKDIQKKIVEFFQTKLKIWPSNNCFAYTQNRSHIDAVKVHQKNKSRYFLKLDIKDFFPSCTIEELKINLKYIYPICFWTTETINNQFTKMLKLCTLNNVLPQGSPASPYLSNILFIDYDYKINQILNGSATGFNRQKYVYTRYADDLLISAKNAFKWNIIQECINIILHPFHKLKTEKTRYGSRNGRNWNLGVMLNKDNNITIGYKTKQNLKAMLHQFILAHRANDDSTCLSIHDIQEMSGLLNYYKQVEPDYINHLIRHYSKKFDINIERTIKQYLKHEII